MKTFVLWTHYDCEVYTSLWATREEAYKYLAQGWLEDCDEDNCGHGDEIASAGIQEIASALEYHFDDLSYDINEMEVPVAYTTPEDIEEMGQTIRSALDRNTMPAVLADDLMARLESFSEQS